MRGDLQPYSDKETYAATLAAKSFRILVAIITKFDLDTIQMDAVSAFTNSLQDEVVYIEYPDGFKRPGWALLL